MSDFGSLVGEIFSRLSAGDYHLFADQSGGICLLVVRPTGQQLRRLRLALQKISLRGWEVTLDWGDNRIFSQNFDSFEEAKEMFEKKLAEMTEKGVDL